HRDRAGRQDRALDRQGPARGRPSAEGLIFLRAAPACNRLRPKQVYRQDTKDLRKPGLPSPFLVSLVSWWSIFYFGSAQSTARARWPRLQSAGRHPTFTALVVSTREWDFHGKMATPAFGIDVRGAAVGAGPRRGARRRQRARRRHQQLFEPGKLGLAHL